MCPTTKDAEEPNHSSIDTDAYGKGIIWIYILLQ